MARDGQAGRESILGLARQLISGFIGLAKIELAHGRQEVGEMLVSTRGAAVRIGIGLAFVFLALIAFVGFVVLGLASLTGLPAWLIALILFVLFGLAAGLLAYTGIKRIKIGPPNQTIASVREDINWAKRLLRRG